MTLVTGATGFIGQQLAKHLLKQGERVRLLVRDPDKARQIFGSACARLTLWRGDLGDPERLKGALDGVEQLYHCAARVSFQGDWHRFIADNVEGTRHLLDACLAVGRPRVLHFSSIAAGGPAVAAAAGTLRPRQEEDEPAPLNCPYGRSKLAQERLVLSYQKRGLQVVVVRPSAVFGPGDRGGVNQLLRFVSKGRAFFYLGSRRGYRNLVYIGDVVHGTLLAMEKGRSGEVYNLVGSTQTQEELFALLAAITGKRPPLLELPVPIMLAASRVLTGAARLAGRSRSLLSPADVRNITANWNISGEKAERQLGLRMTDHREAWLKTLRWLQTEGAI